MFMRNTTEDRQSMITVKGRKVAQLSPTSDECFEMSDKNSLQAGKGLRDRNPSGWEWRFLP